MKNKELAAEYLRKQPSFYSRIAKPPGKDLGYIVVIPCNDEPEIVSPLESLWHCKRPRYSVEVIVVINSAEGAPDKVVLQNTRTYDQIHSWKKDHTDPDFQFFCIRDENQPIKFAGPGLSRKTGMDEAVFRFINSDVRGGIICSMDADSICDNNYFIEIENLVSQYPGTGGASIYFEHPVEGDDYNEDVYKAITLYELHMRYYFQALLSTGFPYAHHTLGSAFFITTDTYVKHGGMNRRKAGEDFYFLQKVVPNVEFHNLCTTRVIPSPRPSDRVPFGTGPWIRKYVNKEVETFKTYNLNAFTDLGFLFSSLPEITHKKRTDIITYYLTLPDTIRFFISQKRFLNKICEINNNTSTPHTFKKRFFNWFNEFRIIKFLNFVHQDFYQRVDITLQARNFLIEFKNHIETPSDPSGLLAIYRNIEKS